MTPLKVFAGYPANPAQVGNTIEQAIAELGTYTDGTTIASWKNLDIAGRFIAEGVMKMEDDADIVVTDITRLNFNVTFEAGYALGKQKRLVPIVNRALQSAKKEIDQLGIFDTIGYQEYENAGQLRKMFAGIGDTTALNVTATGINRRTPIYVLDTLHKTDTALRILSRIKKSRIGFRSFDPKEQSRLSAVDAYRNVASSIAVVVNLLSPNSTDYLFNNLRGAFVAGLAYGFGKTCLVLQEGEEPVPLDYRDFVTIYRQPSDIDSAISELAPRVAEGLQEVTGERPTRQLGLLEKLDLGQPAAENEMTSLGAYYVETDEYNKTLAGNARLVIGRKGSGKTALFFQVRDRIRRNRRHIVLDLKPDGHQLKRFKHLVLDLLADAVKEHVAKAFWEYLLLLEIAYKLLEKDRQVHAADNRLYEPYKKLASAYQNQDRRGEGDFSERMWELVQRISDEFTESNTTNTKYLTAGEVTALVYRNEMPQLLEALKEYLAYKEDVWVLFDNIDKGWPTHGVEVNDILILRALLEATRHLTNSFAREKLSVRSVVFVRNDVYELLVNESPDRGKESRVSLDWTDPDLLREFLRRRIVHNEGFTGQESFTDAWSRVCVSHVSGEDSADYLIDRSLMRPRNLLTVVNYCKSNAVNLQHPQITPDDVLKAFKSYSADIVNELGLEIRDVCPEAMDLLYYFIDSPQWLSLEELSGVLAKSPIPEAQRGRVIELLLWFSFIGIVRQTSGDVQETYIFDVNYDMKKLRRIANDLNNPATVFCIHPSFWPFLDIQAKR